MQHFKGLELKKVTLNTFFQLVVRLTSSASTLVATLLIAFYSGYDMLGSFTKIVSFVSIFYLLVDFGLNPIFLKLHFEDTKKNLGNLFLLRILLSFAAMAVIFLILLILPYDAKSLTGYSPYEKYGIILFSFTVLTTGIFMSTQVLLQKKLTYKLSLLPSFLSEIFLIFFIFISLQKHDLMLLLLSYVISSVIQALLMFYVLKKNYMLALSSFRFVKFSKILLLASFPIGLMLTFNLLYSKVDTIILSIFKSNIDVGIYGISYRFFEVAIAIPAFLSTSTYPLLLKEQPRSLNYFTLLKKYSSLFLLVSLVATLGLFFCAPLIGLFKAGFSLAVLPLQILSLSLPFFFLTSLYQWHFVIHNKTKFLVPLYGGALLLNIILNLIFIPVYSYIAAAVSTALCEAIVFLVMLWYFRRTRIA